jgi:methionyl-tRNA formyltransferase
MKPRIIFFGNERIATGVTTTAPTLRALIEAGYDIAAVVSNYEPGRSRSSRELEVQAVAETHNIPLLLPDKPVDIIDELNSFKAELGVLVAYGRIVPVSIINLFPKGIINIHPSLLPLHRGPTPIESVILNGEEKTGVSLMQLVKAMDAGPVYAYSELSLTGHETKQELADKLLEMGSTMLIELLPEVLTGKAIAQPQDESLATYDSLLSKADGKIDWGKTATRLEREIRAYSGWPKSYTELASKEVVITKAHTSMESGPIGKAELRDKELIVFTGQGSLIIDSLVPAGKKEMTAAEFIHGYGQLIIR